MTPPLKPVVPTVGRIVHYTVRDGQRAGETRAAIITRTFHQRLPDGTEIPSYKVNLTVFPDESNHAMHEERYASSVDIDDTGKRGTWRYQPAMLPPSVTPEPEPPAPEPEPKPKKK